MNINEKNILIARFVTDEPEVLKHDLKKAGTVESMHYHDDWLFLMPVVEKIERLDFQVSIRGCSVTIYSTSDKHPYFQPHSVTKSKLESTYRAVIKFLEWYNNYLYTSGQKS